MNPPDAPNPLPLAWLEFPDGRTHWLEGTCTVGRLSTNQLVLNDSSVSRHHAVLQPDAEGGHFVADLRSTNGTIVNGRRIEAATALVDQDRIRIGDFDLRYRSNRAPGTDAQSEAPGVTSVQIHHGPCWLMLFDVVGFTALTRQLGSEAASKRIREWIDGLRPVISRSGGTINSYQGDAIFAYWRADLVAPTQVVGALREALEQQASSVLPFRIICHHGAVRISGGIGGEDLSGPDVIFLFRIEKATKVLGSQCVISEPAASSLQLISEARFLGKAAVQDYPGDHSFYGLAAPGSHAPAGHTVFVPGGPRRILLVEEPLRIGGGLSRLIEAQDDFRISARTALADARRLCREQNPDVVLLDLSDPTTAIPLGRDMLAAQPRLRIVALLPADANSELVEAVTQVGVAGCVSRGDPTNEVLRSMRMVCDGQRHLSAQFGGQV